MKKWLIMLVGLTLFVSGCQKDPVKDDEPLGEAASTEDTEHSGWNTDFEKASAKAKAEGKYMLVDFSGSDWCGWCIKLDNEVFSKETFKAYAKENLVLMLADFPRDSSKQTAEVQEQNKALSEKFGIRGFPTVIILDAEGEAVAQTGYQAGGPEAYIEHIKKLIADTKK